MSDTDNQPAPRLFTPAECQALGRCPECQCHPEKQGHAMTCPTRWTWRSKQGRTK